MTGLSVDLGMIQPNCAQQLVDQLLAALEAQGVAIDRVRGQAIVDDFNADIRKAVRRIHGRLEAAAGACQALGTRTDQRKSCEEPGTSTRDGYRVCGRHARAARVRWSALTSPKRTRIVTGSG